MNARHEYQPRWLPQLRRELDTVEPPCLERCLRKVADEHGLNLYDREISELAEAASRWFKEHGGRK